jgi:hypothetical protein
VEALSPRIETRAKYQTGLNKTESARTESARTESARTESARTESANQLRSRATNSEAVEQRNNLAQRWVARKVGTSPGVTTEKLKNGKEILDVKSESPKPKAQSRKPKAESRKPKAESRKPLLFQRPALRDPNIIPAGILHHIHHPIRLPNHIVRRACIVRIGCQPD